MITRILSIGLVFSILCGILYSSTVADENLPQSSPYSIELEIDDDIDVEDEIGFENTIATGQIVSVNKTLRFLFKLNCLVVNSIDPNGSAYDASRAPPFSI